ncbi:ABC transporter substrate-binding protein [Rhizobium sp. Root1220]|uniref:ABC transporter substrate-binding protein n=1 Tax=Rhizobium sp. Root1220 TaxID=1736432 RepID=UPI00138F28C8|nr:ABC transporter substrate-binding protein [Rhizobium sp. Root1220]
MYPVLLAGVLATGAGVSQVSPSELNIGVMIEATGPLSDVGPSVEKAAKLAVEVANRASKEAGINLTVHLVAADSQGNPQAAVSAARTLVDRNASCILGPATTPETIAVLNSVTMQREITLWPQASSTRLRSVEDQGTIFRTVAADDLQSKALVLAIENYIGVGKKVAIIFRNEPYGDALSRIFAKDWQGKGGAIVANIAFDPQQEGFDSEASRALEHDPDAYLVIDYPDTYAKLGAALVRTGKFDPRKLFVADALSFAKVPGNIPAQAIEGAHGVAGGSPRGTGAYDLFAKLWEDAGGVEDGSYTANIFDAGILCFLSAVEAGSTEPRSIRDKVRSVTQDGARRFTIENLSEAVKHAAAGEPIDYVGVSGAFRFGPNGDPTNSLYDIFQYQGGDRLL